MADAAVVIGRPPPRGQPIWLAPPGRWSGLDRAPARIALVAIALVAAVALASARGVAAAAPDGSLGLALVDAVRHGGDYHAVLADVVRSGGAAGPRWTTPLPTLFLIEARVPSWIASTTMMLLAVAVVLAWYARFGGLATTRAARIVALLLMLAGAAVALRLPLVAVPEGWAGLLVALSLARRGPGGPVEAAALGLAAATLSCAALPYAAVMALAAARERAWREGIAWGLVLATGVGIVLLHDHALSLALPATGPDPSSQVPPPGLVVATMGAATGLGLLPSGLASPLAVLATIGWAGRREAAGARVALLVAGAGGMVALGLPDAALVAAPLLPLGLVALPDAIRDLLAAALDRRRITVTRVVR